MKRTFLIGMTAATFLALFAPQPAESAARQRRLGRTVVHMLKVDQGARMAGMGGTFVALADNIETIHVNPAGLTHVERMEFSLAYTRWLVDSRFYSGALAYNTGHGVLGLSVLAFTPTEMLDRTIYQPLGTGRTLDAGDVSIGTTYALKITDRLSFGFMLRWTQETLDVDRINAFDVSVGTLFYTGFRSLRLGMTFGNLGKNQEVLDLSYHMPTAFKFAFAMEALGEKGAPAYLTVTAENYYVTDFAEPQYRLGGELWLRNTLALRGGYKFNFDLETYSLGAGVRFSPVAGRELRADVAYTGMEDAFEAPLRFSISGSF